MNYLLYGSEKFLIEKELKNIIKKYSFSDVNISKYDLELDNLKDIIEDANTTSLFDSKKLIIINNAFVFSRTTKKCDDVSYLENYLLNSNNNTIIVFINYLEKLDSIKKIVKAITNNGIVKEYNKLNSINSIVKDMFDDYNVSNEVINLIIKQVGNNLELLYQEIEKLKLYKIDDKIINIYDVEEIISKNTVIDIFKFVDDIINKKKIEAIATYYELIQQNEEPIKIIGLLASKFRLMYQSSVLTKKGYTEEQLSEILGVHKYPIHLALVTGYKYNPKLLLNYLQELAQLDIDIKSGKKQSSIALELFILSI